MITRVALLRRLPQQLAAFDYEVPAAVIKRARVGTIVQVPFRSGKIFGVIIELLPQSEQKDIKAIIQITSSSLTTKQLILAQWLSDYYHLSISTVINLLFAPAQPLKPSRLNEPLQQIASRAKQRQKISTLATNCWCLYDDWNRAIDYLRTVLKQTKVGQTLIIFPEYYWLELLKDIIDEFRPLMLPAKSQKNAYWQAWDHSRVAPIILGTFHSLWLPFSSLKQLIILDPENPQFNRSEQNPRLHLTDLLTKFSELYQCPTLLLSSAPTTNLFQQSSKRKLPVKSIETKRQNISLVDLTAEYRSGNYGPLSAVAMDAINSNRQTLLYLNHYGTANMVLCQRCGWIANCPQCERVLSYSSQLQKLECWNCGQKSEPLANCPRCGYNRLKLKSSGLSRLVRSVADLFPEKKLAIFTNRLNLDEQRADIVIATSKILSTALRFDLTVAVNPDLELWRADFNATEQLRRHLRQLLIRSNHLIVQTRSPNHYLYQSLTHFKSYIGQELAFRQEFAYPPFVSSYRFFNKNRKDPGQLTQALEHDLKAISQGQILKLPKHDLLLRGELTKSQIDSLYQKYNNDILIEINPYQWN